MEPKSAVVCKEVIKEFGDGADVLRVLHELSANFQMGELSLLYGPSGCGKTTLISAIAGILSLTSGTIELFGENLGLMSSAARSAFRLQNVGFVFQQPNLIASLNAQENASIPLIAAGVRRKVAIARAAELLQGLGLGDRLDHLPSGLSGGEQQRVAIARALVHKPRLIVCDEPTSALDAANGHKVLTLLKDLAVSADTACIVVTHDPRIRSFAHRIFQMEDGRIISQEIPT